MGRDVKKPVRVMDIPNSSPVHILPSDPDRKHKKHTRRRYAIRWEKEMRHDSTIRAKGSRSTAQKAH
ncbi:hypothetical protein MKW98_024855 [Papaver atlanticum]|uniref:Uncharacterized protein n=1 Tax=Papaver atlanticum TaxID=357466 RepID=A0AAD4XSI9_9MAGN|nr:hypothetical protein MKW98_024855 [Papaver atlanticum]